MIERIDVDITCIQHGIVFQQCQQSVILINIYFGNPRNAEVIKPLDQNPDFTVLKFMLKFGWCNYYLYNCLRDFLICLTCNVKSENYSVKTFKDRRFHQ